MIRSFATVAPVLFASIAGCLSITRTVRSSSTARSVAAGNRQVGAPTGAFACGSSVTPSPPLVQRFESLAQRLAQHGVHYQGIVAAGFITHGTNVVTPLDIPAGRCVSVIALTSPGIRDLDAHLFSPEGDVLAEDIETDNHPTVQLCASEPRRVYHVIEAYEEGPGAPAQGAYAIATFVSDRQGLEQVARLIGGRPGTALTAGATASEAERRLGELRVGIARRGFLPAGDVVRTSFPVAGATRLPLPVTVDRCYTIAAIADGSLTDTDVSVYDTEGEEIARDVRPEKDAFVQFCPAASGTLSIEIRATPGPGQVLVQSFAADAATVGGANTLWLGERVAWGASAVSLQQAVQSTRQSLSAQGFNPVGNAIPMTFAPGESRDASIPLEPGRCTAVAAIPGRGLGRMQLSVHDREGNFLARGVARTGASIAVLCPVARETVTVRVRAEVGSGEAVVQTFSTTGSVPAWGANIERTTLSEAFAQRVTLLQGGWRADGDPERLRVGARAIRLREFDLAAGTCTRFVVSTGQALPLVALVLRTTSGQNLAEGSGEGTAVVTRCARSGERVRLEISIDPPDAHEYDGVIARYVRNESSTGER